LAVLTELETDTIGDPSAQMELARAKKQVKEARTECGAEIAAITSFQTITESRPHLVTEDRLNRMGMSTWLMPLDTRVAPQGVHAPFTDSELEQFGTRLVGVK
jgi:hypothetical protein